MKSLLLFLITTVLACAGCEKSAPSAGFLPTDPGEPTEAQPKLQTMKLYIGQQEMNAELALSPQQVRTGMMFRTNMDENAGMLFVLPYNQRAAFWMKNCPYPLSAAYIDPEGVIQEIHPLEPFNTNSVIARSDNVRFVLETPRGWFDKHGVKPGVVIATERGSLWKTFVENK
jgi:uncharacterized membrane protein (UPF0127 family)